MGIYVLLLKEYEDESMVIYRLGPTAKQMGRIELSKATHHFFELEPVPGTAQDSQIYFQRAVWRLARCLREENGVFPNGTCFAGG